MAERDCTEMFTTAGVTPCRSGARVGTPFLLAAKGKPECAGKTMPSKIASLAASKTSRKAFFMDLLFQTLVGRSSTSPMPEARQSYLC